MRTGIAVRRSFLLLGTLSLLSGASARAADSDEQPARDEVDVQRALEQFSKSWTERGWGARDRRGRQVNFMRPFHDEGWKVRMRTLQRLVRAGEASIPPLLEVLEKGDVPRRILAAQTLGYLSPHVPQDPLKKTIRSDESAAVRLYAVDALGMQGGDVREFLESRLEDEKNRDVKLHIKYALEREGRAVERRVIDDLLGWDPSTIDSTRQGEPAPDFRLSTVSGKTIRLSDYRGKKHVVLVFVYGDT